MLRPNEELVGTFVFEGNLDMIFEELNEYMDERDGYIYSVNYDNIFNNTGKVTMTKYKVNR